MRSTSFSRTAKPCRSYHGNASAITTRTFNTPWRSSTTTATRCLYTILFDFMYRKSDCRTYLLGQSRILTTLRLLNRLLLLDESLVSHIECYNYRCFCVVFNRVVEFHEVVRRTPMRYERHRVDVSKYHYRGRQPSKSSANVESLGLGLRVYL